MNSLHVRFIEKSWHGWQISIQTSLQQKAIRKWAAENMITFFNIMVEPVEQAIAEAKSNI